MAWNLPDSEDIGRKTLLGATVVSGVLFALSFTFPVEIRVLVGDFGDVSGVLGLLWKLGTGIATFLSLGLAVRSYRVETEATRSGDDTAGPDTSIHIEGVDGDVDLDITVGDDGEIRTGTSDESTESEESENEESEREGETV